MCYHTKFENLVEAVLSTNHVVSLGARYDAIRYYTSVASAPICRYYKILIDGVDQNMAVGYSDQLDKLCIIIDTEEVVPVYTILRNPENGCWSVNSRFDEVPNYKKMKSAARLLSMIKEVRGNG